MRSVLSSPVILSTTHDPLDDLNTHNVRPMVKIDHKYEICNINDRLHGTAGTFIRISRRKKYYFKRYSCFFGAVGR